MASNMSAKDPTLVLVVWEDAHADASEALSLEDMAVKHRAAVFQTVGWLIIEDEKGVSVANERCLDAGDEVYRGRTFIPKSLIRSVTPVFKPRKPKLAPKPPAMI